MLFLTCHIKWLKRINVLSVCLSGNHLPNCGWVIGLFRLSFCWCVDIGFRSRTFCSDALILLKVCRRIYHRKIQVKFDINNHPQTFGRVMALFRLKFCWRVDIGFRSITFAGMHWFYWKFAERYIIVKYRLGLLLVIIRIILVNLRPFFDLVFVVEVKYKVKILFPFNNFWRDALISFEVCRMVYHYSIEFKFDFGNHREGCTSWKCESSLSEQLHLHICRTTFQFQSFIREAIISWNIR